MTRLLATLAACLLALPCAAQKDLVTPGDFVLVGGWRVPAAVLGTRSMSFSQGGIAKTPNGFWLTHHAGNRRAMRFTAGTVGSGSTVTSWPLLTAGQHVAPLGSELTTAIGTELRLMGLLWDEADQRLWASGRSIYAALSYNGAWLYSVDFSENPDGVVEGPTIEGSIQTFGGGFTRIPDAWATAHTGGKWIGLAAGGYESGQNSRAGPSLAASDGVTRQTLLQFGSFAGPKEEREHRPPDYIAGAWAIAPDPPIGYWFAGEARGGAAWVEDSTRHGLCFMIRQGIGQVDYTLQNDTFTTVARSMMYVYDPDELAEVAAAERTAGSLRGAYAEWESQGVQGTPRGCVFDNGLLYVFMQGAYKPAIESLPAVAVYQLASGAKPTCTVAPTTSGSLVVGEERTATAGTWTGNDNGSVNVRYRWILADDASGTNAMPRIGTTAATITLVASDAGKYIARRERGINLGGFSDESDTLSAWAGPITLEGAPPDPDPEPETPPENIPDPLERRAILIFQVTE